LGVGDALAAQLSMLCGSKDLWPTDINQTYLKVAKHVFRSIEGENMNQPSNVTVENR
jgi:hypothetical protein